jgi:hypothetical protein
MGAILVAAGGELGERDQVGGRAGQKGNRVPAAHKRRDELRTDETGSTGHQHFHSGFS